MITRVNQCLASVNKGSCTYSPPPHVDEWGGGGGTKTLFIRVGFGWRSKYLQCRNWFPSHITTEGTLHLFSYIFNRAAMGRARFLLCTGFIIFIIINRAAMGRARFLFYTGFIINRAAMGRARFLFYTGFIINRAAMGRARFLLYTGFINRAAMGRARFLLCTGFFFFFFRFFVGDQTQTSPRPNHDRD